MRDGAQNQGRTCRIQEISRAGYGIKISWRYQDRLISIGGMRDGIEIDSGMWDFKQQVTLLNLTERDQDKDS